MNLRLAILFYFFVLTVFSQNSPVKCEMTTWPLIGGYQVDSYNAEGNKIDFIMVNKAGDTTQFWKNEFDSDGFLIRHYTIIERHNPFDYRYIRDSIDHHKIGVSFKLNGRDTVVISDEARNKLNEFGDPLYNYRYGDIHYIYNLQNKKIKEICIEDSGDTTGVGYYDYDEFNNQIQYKWFEKDSLTYTLESEYDSNGNVIHEIQKNGAGKILYEVFNEYDDNQYKYRSYGTDFHMKEPEPWEMVFKIIECE